MAKNIKKVKILGEWIKGDHPRAPHKAAMQDLDNDKKGDLVYWGETLKKIIISQYYEVEINKISDDDFGLQYTVKKHDEKGKGPVYMEIISTTEGEKIRSAAVKDKRSTEVVETEIKIIGRKWNKSQKHADLWRIEARNLESENVEDGWLVYNGITPPTIKMGETCKYWVIINRSEGEETRFTIKETALEISDEGSNSSIAIHEPNFIKYFLDVLHSEDSLNYVTKYKEYRASSVNSCVRKILIVKWRRDLTPAELEIADKILKQFDYDRQRIGAAAVGTSLHNYLEDVNKKYPDIYKASEEKIIIELDGIRIVGHYDLLVEIEGQKYVVDIKTTNPKNTGGIYEFKKEEHFGQLIIYQHALGGLPGLILYVERNSGKLTVFKQEYDIEKFMKVFNRLKKVAAYEEMHILPMIPGNYGKNKWPCKAGEWQCEFWSVCWEGTTSIKTEERK